VVPQPKINFNQYASWNSTADPVQRATSTPYRSSTMERRRRHNFQTLGIDEPCDPRRPEFLGAQPVAYYIETTTVGASR